MRHRVTQRSDQDERRRPVSVAEARHDLEAGGRGHALGGDDEIDPETGRSSAFSCVRSSGESISIELLATVNFAVSTAKPSRSRAIAMSFGASTRSVSATRTTGDPSECEEVLTSRCELRSRSRVVMSFFLCSEAEPSSNSGGSVATQIDRDSPPFADYCVATAGALDTLRRRRRPGVPGSEKSSRIETPSRVRHGVGRLLE